MTFLATGNYKSHNDNQHTPMTNSLLFHHGERSGHVITGVIQIATTKREWWRAGVGNYRCVGIGIPLMTDCLNIPHRLKSNHWNMDDQLLTPMSTVSVHIKMWSHTVVKHFAMSSLRFIFLLLCVKIRVAIWHAYSVTDGRRGIVRIYLQPRC
jgi:hypothetical protein